MTGDTNGKGSGAALVAASAIALAGGLYLAHQIVTGPRESDKAVLAAMAAIGVGGIVLGVLLSDRLPRSGEDRPSGDDN